MASKVKVSVKKYERDKKLYLATADVMSDEFSLREASEKYGIPKSTIWNRASGKVAFGAISGPPKYLNSVEEEHLVKFLIEAAKIGFPRSKKQILAIVRAILAKKRACNNEDVQVSPGWWGSFKKRHPMLTLQSGSKVAFRRAIACTPDTINSYFDILEEAIKSNNLQNSPMSIYNCDESGFPLEHKPCKAIGLRGQRDLPCLTSGDKTQLTVLSACSASGYLLPPMIIFDRKRLKPAFTVGEVPGTAYGLSKKGWIDSELFEDWFTNHFLLHIPPQRPVLLLVDGHSSHHQPQLIRKAVQNHVILFCLPPYTTHLCQPLDRTCFSSLKSAYYDQCQQFASENPGQVVNRNFTQIFCRAWTRAMTPANIIAGFRATGVFPLNRYAVLHHISDISSGECETADLADQMGIFVPLYSPMKKSGPNVMSDEDDDDDDKDMIDTSDDVDDTSPQEQDNEEETTSTKKPEEPASYISELLVLPKPPAQSARRYTARVLTSQENIKAIEEKEREKARKEEEKELRKMEREKKKVEQERKKMEQERKKMERQTKRQVNNRKEVAFTKEEHQRYTLRHENGYDIPEERYCQWLKTYYPDDPLVASISQSCSSAASSDNERGGKVVSKSIATRVTRSQSNRYLCSSDGSVGNVISKPSSKATTCSQKDTLLNDREVVARPIVNRVTRFQNKSASSNESGGKASRTAGCQKETAISKPLVTKSTQHSKVMLLSDNESENSQETYCICKSEESGRMVQCDGEDCPIGWWHFECANIKKTPVGDWFCNYCKQ